SVQMFGRLLHLPALLAAAQAQSFDGPGSLLVLLAPAETGPAGEVDIGRTMLRMWLGLTRYGLAAHPHSHLIDCPDTGDRLAQLAGAANERVVWLARVGRPDYETAGNVPMSARRTGADANGGHGPAGGLDLLPGAGTGIPLGDLLGRYVPQ